MTEPPETQPAFGARLRSLRLAARMSLGDLAVATHYSKGHLSRLENGAKTPSIEFARVSDAALAAGGELIRLVSDVHPSPAEELEKAAPPTQSAAPPGPAVDKSVRTFGRLLENLRELGQILGPSMILPMLLPQTNALAQLATHVDRSQVKEVLFIAARFAEYTGWMSQESGDDQGALQWTEEAGRLAGEAGDHDMVAYVHVRRANIALYRQDAYGVVSNSRHVQSMACSPRVKGLAAQREAQGHALAGQYDDFARCIEAAVQYRLLSDLQQPDPTTLGAVRIPDSVALSKGWGLYDLGRNDEAVETLSELFDGTEKEDGRAWARIGVRYTLALVAIGEIDRACATVKPILVMLPAMESATIRSDVQQLARILNRRWSGHPSVRELMPVLSAALTPSARRAVAPPEAEES